MLLSVEQAKKSLRVLGTPINRDNLRKCSRAKHLLDYGHIKFLPKYSTDYEHVYHVASQWEDGTIYTISLNGTSHSCSCPDPSDLCKHRIACKMYEYKQEHQDRHQHKEMVTFTADSITGFECHNVSIWYRDKFYSVSMKDCQVDGLTVTMPKGIADRLGIDYRFDYDRPLYADDPKFDYNIFRHEAESYKLEALQSMYGGVCHV